MNQAEPEMVESNPIDRFQPMKSLRSQMRPIAETAEGEKDEKATSKRTHDVGGDNGAGDGFGCCFGKWSIANVESKRSFRVYGW
jgi:hypothetical protein